MRRVLVIVAIAAGLVVPSVADADAGRGALEAVQGARLLGCVPGVRPRWAWCWLTGRGTCIYRAHMHYRPGWGWEAWAVSSRYVFHFEGRTYRCV